MTEVNKWYGSMNCKCQQNIGSDHGEFRVVYIYPEPFLNSLYANVNPGKIKKDFLSFIFVRSTQSMLL